ncbi:MAG: hypothetical protein U0905_19205 [Pirellulales bacterium]
MNRWVDISFDCLPLRSVARLDPPIDASPKLAAKMMRIKDAVEKHGTYNTYYLHNAKCIFHLTNDDLVGFIQFTFEGTVFTDTEDLRALRSDLTVTIDKEDCDWLNQGIVEWFAVTVRHAVLVEFGRYIAAGDLAKTRERLAAMEKSLESQQGYVGMYL